MSKPNHSTYEVAQALDINFSKSNLVSLNEGKIDSLCERIRSRTDFSIYNRETWSDPFFWNSEDAPVNRSQYFAIGNAINFRYWKLGNNEVTPSKGSKKGSEFKGSMYMWRCLRLCVENGNYPLLDATFLANITENEFDEIFSSDSGDNPLEVGKEDRLKPSRSRSKINFKVGSIVLQRHTRF